MVMKSGKLVDSKGFFRSCITLRITVVLDLYILQHYKRYRTICVHSGNLSYSSLEMKMTRFRNRGRLLKDYKVIPQDTNLHNSSFKT
jgi:hypothetical protein